MVGGGAVDVPGTPGDRAALNAESLRERSAIDLARRSKCWYGSTFVDAGMPDGSSLHVVVRDICGCHCSVNIRKFVLSGKLPRRARRPGDADVEVRAVP